MFRKFFLFLKFRYKKWQKYSAQKHFKCLQKFEDFYAHKQHRQPCKLVLGQNLPSNVYGVFKGDDWTITVNPNLIYNSNLMFCSMSTLLHEGRHAFQRTHVKNVYSSNKRVFKFSKAYKWRNSFGGYLDTTNSDYTDYANQSIELDANMYAYKQLKKLSHKYKKEKLYFAEVYRLEDWFKDVAKMGKEKYGIFYKFKIGRKNKKLYEKDK